MRKVTVLLAAALTLSACGEVSQQAEDTVKKEVAATLARECTNYIAASNAASMVPADKAQAICECTTSELVATKSMGELANLNMESTMPIVQKCAGQVGLEMSKAAAE